MIPRAPLGTAEYSPLNSDMYSQRILRLGTFSSRKNGEYDVGDDGNIEVVIDGFIIVCLPPPSSFLMPHISQGFGVYSHQISEMEFAWTAYQHLQDLNSLPDSSSLFPVPIATDHSEDFQSDLPNLGNTSLVYFVFATPHLPSLVPFSAIAGMSLAENLRKYPLVLRRWCSQLGTAYHELKRFSQITLQAPTIDDVFITEV